MQRVELRDAEYGDIILFEPVRAISRLQAAIDSIGQKGANYSHGAIFWGRDGNEPMMIESVTHCGVHVTRVQDWRNFVVIRPDKSNLRSREEMAQFIGLKYDFSKIWRILAARLFRFPLVTDDSQKVICTELNNLAYRYTLCPKGQCTPVSLYNALNER